MNDMEMSAALEALDEVKSVLTKHWMRKPQANASSETTIEDEPAPTEVSVEIEAESEPMEEDMSVGGEVDEMIRDEMDAADEPVRVVDAGIPRRGIAPPKPEQAPSPPVAKRGRGRPRKVR